MNSVKIIGTGRYTPDNVVTNDDLSKIVDTNDEWISTRTGIRERRITSKEDTTELALKAAVNALKRANISAESLDLIIVGTISPDSFMPSIACKLQGELGAVNAAAFDMTAACSGFIYGLEIAKNFIMSGKYKRALVIGAEVLSKIIDWKDRNTCILFGDGAAAAVVEASEKIDGIRSIKLGSDGSKGQFLTCPAVELKNLLIKSDGTHKNTIWMAGREIFKFGVNTIYECVNRILEENKLRLNDIKYIVPHQANSRMIDSAAKKLKINSDKFYTNMQIYGNTSSASIGIALDEMVEKNMLHKGDKVIIIGFGGGLTWGSALIEWSME